MSYPREEVQLRRDAWAHRAWAATHQASPETSWHWREAVRADEELARRAAGQQGPRVREGKEPG